MKLRSYQQQSIDAILHEWETVDKTLLVLPTGCGKTIVFCKLTEHLVTNGKNVLILAHRDELIRQAQDKLMISTGLGSAIEKADETAEDSWYQVTCGSVQTLMREKRLQRFAKDHYDVIIIDEAHHCLSTSYQNILNYFDGAKVLGVTATPDRGDKKNLGQVFDTLAYEYHLPMAIKEGFLSPIKALTIPLQIELGKLSTQAGDFKSAELGCALEPYLDNIVEEMITYCMDRKTIVFLPLIAISQEFQSKLNAAGFRAAEINGTSKDRKEILEDFHNDKYNVLCNSMLLTEGFDEPSVDCIVCLRPTKVRSLYCQIVGRGTRLSPGKEDLLVLDFLWNTENHELCRPANLIAGDLEVAKKMTEIAEEKAGQQLELEGLELEAESEVVTQRKEALAKKLEEQRRKKRRSVDPLQYYASINAEDLLNYIPAFGWEMAPASKKQLALLEKRGINTEEVGCAGAAAKLLDRLQSRQSMGLATPKQIKLLERYNYQEVGLMQFQEARKLIDKIAANNWRRV